MNRVSAWGPLPRFSWLFLDAGERTLYRFTSLTNTGRVPVSIIWLFLFFIHSFLWFLVKRVWKTWERVFLSLWSFSLFISAAVRVQPVTRLKRERERERQNDTDSVPRSPLINQIKDIKKPLASFSVSVIWVFWWDHPLWAAGAWLMWLLLSHAVITAMHHAVMSSVGVTDLGVPTWCYGGRPLTPLEMLQMFDLESRF